MVVSVNDKTILKKTSSSTAILSAAQQHGAVLEETGYLPRAIMGPDNYGKIFLNTKIISIFN